MHHSRFSTLRSTSSLAWMMMTTTTTTMMIMMMTMTARRGCCRADDETTTMMTTTTSVGDSPSVVSPSASAAAAAAASGVSVIGGGSDGILDARECRANGSASLCIGDCQCTLTGHWGLILRCQSRDSMLSFPVVRSETCRSRVREIFITDQTRLTELKASTLEAYPELEELTIQYSGLKTISVEAFKTSKYLKSINLRSNQLTTLPWSTFIDMPRIIDLKYLNVEDNPLSCICGTRWLLNSSTMFPLLDLRSSEICGDRNSSRIEWSGCDIPAVEVSTQRVELNVSQGLELTCRGRGVLKPRVYWTLQQHWPTDGYELRPSDDNMTVTLAIPSVAPAHSGSLWCVADNAAGRAKAAVTVVVFSAPKILTLDEVAEEFHHCIPYRISGLPVPNVTWYRDSVVLQTNEIIYDSNVVREEFLSRQGCLTFTTANHLNNGNYTLVAENEYGSDSRSIEAVFLSPPDDSLFRHESPPFFDDLDALGYLHRNDTAPLSDNDDDDELLKDNFAVLVTVTVVTGGVLMLLIFSIVCAIVCCRRKMKPAMQKVRCFRSLCPERNRNSIYCDTIAREMIPLNSSHIIDNPNYFKQEPTLATTGDTVCIPRIPRQNISVLRDLGEGAFGRVVLGTCRLTDATGERQILVAIKTLKENHAEHAREDFEREAKLLTSLQHDNIVRLYGISEDGDTRMIIFEFMENGDLNNFLRSHSTDARFIGSGGGKETQQQQQQQQLKPGCQKQQLLRLRDLLHISKQIASGAEYLAENHFVHRDLATRNCLVGENLTVKIGDFGMSRDVYNADYYKVGGQTLLPIRWMPYESIIYRKFTMESDVWSFGVVLWEIFSFGKQPWYELTNHEVIQYLEMGKVLDCPVGGHCPEEVYRLMLGCWRKHPENRLAMTQLHVHLTRLLQYFDNEPIDDSQDYVPKHVSYLELVADDVAI